MKKTKSLILFLLTLPIILVLGLKLRTQNFATVPFPGDSMDEYSNAWVGLSLISTGMPVGISGLPGYANYYTRYINVDRVYQGNAMGNTMPINYPWFDHPPMMGLTVGGYSYLSGARAFEDTNSALIRKPVILMSMTTMALAAVLAYLVFGWQISILTALIMATSPLMVINSRMVQAENGYTPLFLMVMILMWCYRKYPQISILMVAALVSGLATLFKLSAVTIPIVCLTLILNNKKNSLKTKLQEALIFSVVCFSITGLFVVYGLAFEGGQFREIVLSNSNRVYGIGLNAISELITNTKITGGKYLSDGWPLVGWLGLAFFMSKKTNRDSKKLVWMPILVYLVVYLVFGSQAYGWYRIPFYPFLAIIAAWTILQFWQNKKMLPFSTMALLIPLGINLEKYLKPVQNPGITNLWRMGVPVLLLWALIMPILPKNKWIRRLIWSVMLSLIAITLYTNYLRVSQLTVDYWYKVE